MPTHSRRSPDAATRRNGKLFDAASCDGMEQVPPHLTRRPHHKGPMKHLAMGHMEVGSVDERITPQQHVEVDRPVAPPLRWTTTKPRLNALAQPEQRIGRKASG